MGSHTHGRIAHTAEALWWVATDSRKDRLRGVSFYVDIWNAWYEALHRHGQWARRKLGQEQVDQWGWCCGVCYTPPDQDVVIDETFFRQLWQSSRLPSLVLMGTLKHLSICCKRNTDVLHLLAIPEILGVRWWQLPNTGYQAAPSRSWPLIGIW